ncbi:MAG: hypothetical protein ACREUU_02955 [Gammaproteobacteria bacterium]
MDSATHVLAAGQVLLVECERGAMSLMLLPNKRVNPPADASRVEWGGGQ